MYINSRDITRLLFHPPLSIFETKIILFSSVVLFLFPPPFTLEFLYLTNSTVSFMVIAVAGIDVPNRIFVMVVNNTLRELFLTIFRVTLDII